MVLQKSMLYILSSGTSFIQSWRRQYNEKKISKLETYLEDKLNRGEEPSLD